MYAPFQCFIYRIPFYSYKKLERIVCENEQALLGILHNPKVKEAIYIASPVLYGEIEKLLSGRMNDRKQKRKVVVSFVKYISRMCTRCTPFGLFATCSIGNWSEHTHFSIDEQCEQYVRPDMYYLCELIQNLSEESVLRKNLHYFPNNTIYSIGHKFRYISYRYRGGRRLHTITSVQKSPYINYILKMATKGVQVDRLIDYLKNEGYDSEESQEFIDELISSQILVSELEPNVTGTFYLDQVIDRLNQLYLPSSFSQFLFDFEHKFKEIENGKKDSCLAEYKEIMNITSLLQVPVKEGLLLQVDSVRRDLSSTLGKDILKDMNVLISLWEKLSTYQLNDNLRRFQEVFYERYEECEIPLSLALDTELGVGYPANQGVADINFLLSQLILPARGKEPKNKSVVISDLLFRKFIEMKENGDKEIILTNDDFKDLPEQTHNFPTTIYVMAQLIKDDMGNNLVNVKAIDGEAANLIARFSHLDVRIENLVMEITRKEQELQTDGILAEIVHLPSSRVGNILARPHIRDYEIVYLANSDLPECKQIPISDIMLSCRHNKLVLRSKRFNKKIYPRLTTAHNYYNDTLPVYRFLCDMQQQDDSRVFGLNWGGIQDALKYKPRIRFNNFILAPASWIVDTKEISNLHDFEGQVLVNKIPSGERPEIFLNKYCCLMVIMNCLLILLFLCLYKLCFQK